jgi:outer membrane immunogenic protein
MLSMAEPPAGHDMARTRVPATEDGRAVSRMLLLGCVGLGLLFPASSARAQDAGAAPARLAAPAAPAYDWTGVYVGANGGAAWGRQDPLNLVTNLSPGVNIDYSGGMLGGTGGAQIQIAHVVLGFEGDLDWSGVSGQGRISSTLLAQPFTANANLDMRSIGTGRARFGYAQNNWLFYGTGGVGILGARTELSSVTGVSCGPQEILKCSGPKWRIGGTAGAGVEHGIRPNLSVKLEDLFFAGVALELAKANLIRAGVNYRFGGR